MVVAVAAVHEKAGGLAPDAGDDVEDGTKSGTTAAQNAEHREARKRIGEWDVCPLGLSLPTRGVLMRIAMASDHAGRALKEEIKALLRADGHEISEFGTDTDDAADLPDHVYPAALAVARGDVDRGIFVDGVGYGSAMIANKIAGIYAAVCQDPFCAELARSHSDTNVLCLGGKIIGSAIALEIVRVWMATEWLGEGDGGEKYARRVNKVKDIDAHHLVRLD